MSLIGHVASRRVRGHRSAVLACVVAVMAALAAPLVAGEPIVVTDLLRIRTAGAIKVARDGSKAIVVVNSIAELSPSDGADANGDDHADSFRPKYVNQSHLWLLPLFGDGAPRQLTFGNRRDTQPDISPDGRRVAFVRKGETPGEGAGEPQVWVIDTAGGEARQVTRFKHGASAPHWMPSGRELLCTSALPMDELDGVPPWPSDRPQRTFRDDELNAGASARPDGSREEIRAWLARNEREHDPQVITRLEFHEEQQLRGDDEFAHLFIVNADDSAVPPRRITSGFFNHESAAVMPDGKAIVYAAKKPTNVHPDRVLFTDLWMIGADGTNDRKLLSLDGWTLSNPRPSRDGQVIAFTASKTDEPAYRLSRLGIMALPRPGASPSEPTWLTDDETQDADVFQFDWNPARGASIVFNTASQGGYPLMTISFGLIEPAPLVHDFENTRTGVFHFGVGGGSIVYALSTYANPCEIRVIDANGDRQLFNLNEWTRDKSISKPAEGWVTRPDGVKVQYWLMPPTKREAKAKYPLVLNVHGGPMWMWGPGEPTMWLEFQLMCSFGYGVVYANPRGSTGYGREFQRGNYQNWGEGPAGDVLAVVDKVILEEWVDKDRLVLTGGSYGGYLTAWIVGNDHRFKAAVAQRGVYDFNTFFGEGNAWRLVEETFGGLPFEAKVRDVIARNNPFLFAGRIRTPLLIVHSSNDLRTGVSQSEMLYRALKAQGKPVEYVRYPGEGHELSRSGDPMHRMDRLLRIIEFFDRHVANTTPAPQVGAAEASTTPATNVEPAPSTN